MSEPADRLITAQEAVSRHHITYKQLWQAERAGLIHPKLADPDRDVTRMTFREFMANHGFEFPDPTWSAEDVEAWFEGPPELLEA